MAEHFIALLILFDALAVPKMACPIDDITVRTTQHPAPSAGEPSPGSPVFLSGNPAGLTTPCQTTETLT